MTAGWLQGAINSFTDGRASRGVWVTAAIAVAAGWFAFFAVRQFTGLSDAVAMEHAQLARSLAEGRGFTTRCMRPLDVGFLAGRGVSPSRQTEMPEIRLTPVYAATLASLFRLSRQDFDATPNRLFGPETAVIVPFGIVVSLATAYLLLLLGTRLFDARVGRVAAVVYVSCRGVLFLAIGGGPVPLGTLLWTAALYASVVAAKSDGRGRQLWHRLSAAALAGALLGLSVLTAYTMAAAGIAVLVFLYAACPRQRALPVAVALACGLLVCAPWIVRNAHVSGRPFGNAPFRLLHGIQASPVDNVDRAPAVAISNVRAAAALKAKLLRNTAALYGRHARLLGSGLVMCFFLVSLFHRAAEPEADCLKWSMVAALVALIAAIALQGEWAGDWLLALLPGVVLCGTAYLFDLADRPEMATTGWSSVMVGAYVLLAALPALMAAAGPASPPYPPYYPPLQAHVCNQFAPRETLCTDVPWATAWYGGQRSMLMPSTAENLVSLENLGVRCDGVYLALPREAPAGLDPLSWLPREEVTIPDGFRFTNGVALPPGTRQQLLLTDGLR